MSSGKTLHPEVLWAQRTNELYITINVTDCKDPKINVTKDKISFEGRSGPDQSLYGFELEFHKEVKPETAKRSTTARNIFLVLDKAEKQGYWPRLQKDKTKISFLKTDFSKWKDEDDVDEEEGGPDPLGGMDFSNLMEGGGDSGIDDSDEEMPSLETVDDATKINDGTKEDDGTKEEAKTIEESLNKETELAK